MNTESVGYGPTKVAVERERWVGKPSLNLGSLEVPRRLNSRFLRCEFHPQRRFHCKRGRWHERHGVARSLEPNAMKSPIRPRALVSWNTP